jgi:hypothetical protein
MSRLLFTLFVFISCILPACAQSDDEIACRAWPQTTESYKKKLWDGYEVSLGPARNATGAGEDQCTAAIYNAAGKVVFRTTGFGVIFDEEHTGMDIDGDGKGEVVFRTDQAGGAHCCWIYNVVTLAPRPHKLFDIGEGTPVDFVNDKGGMILWERVGGTYAYSGGVDRPYAERAFRVKGGKLVDATPEFCGKLLSPGSEDYDLWAPSLTPENVKKLQSAKKFGPDANFELDDVVSALLSRAQQKVLCHQYDEAIADLNLWPADSRDEMKDNFAESVKESNPDFAARLSGKTASK